MKAHTFVVNTNNPLMAAIQKLDTVDPELAKDLVKQAYELSLALAKGDGSGYAERVRHAQ